MESRCSPEPAKQGLLYSVRESCCPDSLVQPLASVLARKGSLHSYPPPPPPVSFQSLLKVALKEGGHRQIPTKLSLASIPK